MKRSLRTAVLLGASGIGTPLIFLILFFLGWSVSPIAGMMAFTVAGMVAAFWTRSLWLVAASAGCVSFAVVVLLAWGQLAADNVGVHTPVTDALHMAIRWPEAGYLVLAVVLGAALGSAGWAAGRPLAARIFR